MSRAAPGTPPAQTAVPNTARKAATLKGYEDVGFRVLQILNGKEPGSTHRYIVQPISYVEIADNVSAENSVGATCGEAPAAAVLLSVSYDAASGSLTLSWSAVDGAESYYIYRYHPDANMLSTPKVVTGKTSYTYRQGTADSGISFLITTAQMSSRKYYNGAGAISVVFPVD